MDHLHLKALIVSARNEQLRLWRRGMSELALPHDARDRIASDAAEKLARNKYEALAVDCDTIQGSAGLHGYPLGSHPSPRRGVRHSQHGAKSRGSALMGELHPYRPVSSDWLGQMPARLWLHVPRFRRILSRSLKSAESLLWRANPLYNPSPNPRADQTPISTIDRRPCFREDLMDAQPHSLQRTLLFFLFLCLTVAVAPASDKTSARIVAIADVHGDHDALVQLLARAQLLDAEQRWVGGRNVLVQTGDLVDRGTKIRQVLDLMIALEDQAKSQGGRVISLLGNHEAMNVTGDLRYVTPEIYATFAGPDSEKRREKAWKQYTDWAKRRAKRMRQPEPALGDAARQQWMDAHPPGYFEYLEAFSDNGRYGRWIRKRDTIAKLGGVVFVHGGVDPRLAELGIDGINRRVREELARYDRHRAALVSEGIALPFFNMQEFTDAAKEELEARQKSGAAASALKPLQDFLDYGSYLAINPDGPLWFRGFARWEDQAGSANVDQLLKSFEATHFVVGHSPLADGRIRSRFGGRVFLIDTGMLSSYYKGGRASALDISEGEFKTIYAEESPAQQAEAPRNTSAESTPPALVPAVFTPAQAPPAPVAQTLPASPARTWKGPDGKPLPFRNDEEVLDFLRTAKVVEIKGIPEGITAPQKVLLEKDGVKAHAVFRAIDQEKFNYNTGVAVDMLFRDHYLFEPAAYQLSLLLGLDNVPPAIPRSIGGKSGSVQIWLEGAMNETARKKRGAQPPERQRWAKQMQLMNAFDTLIYNMDRNSGNMLIDPDWKVWFIDHTRAFRRYEDLKNVKKLVQHCERGFFDRLKLLDGEQVREKLSPYLRQAEIKAIMKRRDKLVRYIEELIAKNGENRVLFNWEPAAAQAAEARP